ncbi:MAG: hypothetical protein ABI855_02280 [Bacteroidota bacterium]
MADRNRVPQSLKEFDIYIRRVGPFVIAVSGITTNGERLGLTSVQNTKTEDFRKQWYTGIPATPGAYELHSNPDTKTKTTRKNVLLIIKNFTLFFSPLLTLMSVSPNLTESDRQVLNLPARDTTQTPRGKIEDAPTVNVSSLAGSRMKVRCRIDQDANRASMHELADAIEMKYQVGGAQPANANACVNSFISKRALFPFEAGIENGEKKFYCFCRYVNLTNPDNNGPYSTIQTATIQS